MQWVTIVAIGTASLIALTQSLPGSRRRAWEVIVAVVGGGIIIAIVAEAVVLWLPLGLSI